ncbi:MAG: CPBP family intramembrane metalloprotease [Bacteroidales bacterium]|nr:CPBP family intramembrane metalloprotease [Bacteroidales bacterium]
MINDKIQQLVNNKRKIAIVFFIIYIIFALLGFVLYRFSHYKFFIDFKHIAIAILCGLIAFVINYILGYILKKTKLNTKTPKIVNYYPINLKFYTFIAYIFVVFIEEIVCRSIVFSYVNNNVGVYAAIVVSSLVFSLFHFKYKMVQIFFLGVFFAFLIFSTGNLLVPFIAHLTNNTLILFYKPKQSYD